MPDTGSAPNVQGAEPAEPPSGRPASAARARPEMPSLAGAVQMARCPACGKEVDPLRAGHVAILEGGFHYFCDRACKVAYAGGVLSRSPDEVETAAPPAVALLAMAASRTPPPPAPIVTATAPVVTSAPPPPVALPSAPPPNTMRSGATDADTDVPDLATTPEPARALPPTAERSSPDLPPPTTLRSPSVPSVDLALLPHAAPPPSKAAANATAPTPPPARVAPASVSSVASVASVASVSSGPPPASSARGGPASSSTTGTGSLIAAAGLGAALVVPVLAQAGQAAIVGQPVALVAAAGSLVALVVRADRTAADPLPHPAVAVVPALVAVALALYARIAGAADAGGVAVFASLAAASVLAGELLGERVRAGLPKLLASTRPTAGRGSPLPPPIRLARLTVERTAVVASILAAIVAFASSGRPFVVALTACAVALALATRGAVAAVSAHYTRALGAAAARGITYKDGDAFDRAGRVDRAILCARGTVLSGNPDVVLLEPSNATTEARLVTLAASAESARVHPIAAAVVRAAEGRALPLEELHRVTVKPGLGVTAMLPTGERLLVGSRALLIQEHVSVATADARVTELEALGRSVVLVALGERVIGLLALQDGLCPGARAAVQRLHDARIEPVLLSGDARETCEAVARSLDIEHIRPELLPDEMAGQVRALADGGHVVAVVGRAGADDGALAAAGVAIALAAGVGATASASAAADLPRVSARSPSSAAIASTATAPVDCVVVVASADTRDAALALTLSRDARDAARVAFALGAVPSAVAALAITFASAPVFVAPLALFAGTAFALAHAHAHASAKAPPARSA